MPTVQGIDSFDHGFDVPDDYDAFFNVDGVDPSAVTDPLYQGRLNSLRISPTGSNEGVRKNLTGSPSRGWTGFPYRIASSPSGPQGISRLHSLTSNNNAAIAVTSTREIFAFFTTPGTVESGPVLDVDTWYWIEQIFNVIGDTHTLFWRVNGVDQVPVTVAGTAGDSVQYAQLFSTSGEATWYAGGYWAWGSAASDSDWLGEPVAGSGRRYKRLVGPAQLGTTPATLYTVPTGFQATARRIWANNPTGSPVGLTLSIGADAAGTRLLDDHSIPAGEDLDISQEHNLSAGEVIQAYADTGSALVLMVDGIEEGID